MTLVVVPQYFIGSQSFCTSPAAQRDRVLARGPSGAAGVLSCLTLESTCTLMFFVIAL